MQMLNYSIEKDGCKITTNLGELVAWVRYDAGYNRAQRMMGRWCIDFAIRHAIDCRMHSLEAAKYYVLAIWMDEQAKPTHDE